MNIGLAIAGSALSGVVLTLFLDPASGNRRRAQLRDQISRRVRKAGDFLDVSRRDLRNRALGLFGEARYRVRGREVSDDQLVLRVAAKLGRYVSHPKAIDISAENGCVTLRGLILSREVQPALKAASAVPGVREVASELEEHAEPGSIPVLQGGRRRSGDRKDFLQENWSPATRLLLGTTASLLTIDGLRRGSLVGTAEAAAGALLLARSSFNQPVRRLVELDGKERAASLLVNAKLPRQSADVH